MLVGGEPVAVINGSVGFFLLHQHVGIDGLGALVPVDFLRFQGVALDNIKDDNIFGSLVNGIVDSAGISGSKDSLPPPHFIERDNGNAFRAIHIRGVSRITVHQRGFDDEAGSSRIAGGNHHVLRRLVGITAVVFQQLFLLGRRIATNKKHHKA